MPGSVTTARTYDALGRLATVTSGTAERLIGSFSYTVDDHDRRTRVDLADGGRWEYTYDAAGQLTGGVRYAPRWPDGIEQVLATYGYQYDPMGNPTQRSEDAGVSAYTYNSLNQLVTGTWSGTLSAFGWTRLADLAGVSVTAGQQTEAATVFQNADWTAKGLVLPAGDTALTVTRTAADQTTAQGQATVTRPADAAQFAHDPNGNLLSDGVWTYTWTTECRLVRAEGGNLKAEYVYDGLGRRRSKKVSSWDAQAAAWVLAAETRFVWDGWNLLAELSPQLSALSLQTIYTCGLDLSNQLGGEGQDPMATAGGIGGILAVTSTSSVGGALRAATSVFLYDGNGNVANLADAGGTAAVLATYEYGPFGNTLVASGPLAEANPIRFSTKYFEGAQPPGSPTQPSALFPQPSLYYYGLRFYSPGIGRWASRDPIGERGGVNVHAFAGNAPLARWDGIGLASSCCEQSAAERLAVSTTAGTYRVCCYRTMFSARHCHVQYGPCAKTSKTGMAVTEYPVSLRTDGRLDDGTPCRCATASDLTACAGTLNSPEDPTLPGMINGRQKNCAGGWPGYNCQTCTRDILAKCCLASPWRISWYAGTSRGACIRSVYVPPGGPVCVEYELDKYLGLVPWH